ncbi:hypothetical protein VTK26DRAFT_1266 [Humicola hyalothermophila]
MFHSLKLCLLQLWGKEGKLNSLEPSRSVKQNPPPVPLLFHHEAAAGLARKTQALDDPTLPPHKPTQD